MSIQKAITMKKGIVSNISRIESVTVRNKPDGAKSATITVAFYFDEAEKNIGSMLGEQSHDIPESEFVGNKNPFKAAYDYLKGSGKLFEGGTDC